MVTKLKVLSLLKILEDYDAAGIEYIDLDIVDEKNLLKIAPSKIIKGEIQIEDIT